MCSANIHLDRGTMPDKIGVILPCARADSSKLSGLSEPNYGLSRRL